MHASANNQCNRLLEQDCEPTYKLYTDENNGNVCEVDYSITRTDGVTKAPPPENRSTVIHPQVSADLSLSLSLQTKCDAGRGYVMLARQCQVSTRRQCYTVTDEMAGVRVSGF